MPDSKSISCIQFTYYCWVYYHSYQTSKTALIIPNWANKICLKPNGRLWVKYYWTIVFFLFLQCAIFLHAQNNTHMTYTAFALNNKTHCGLLYSPQCNAPDVQFPVWLNNISNIATQRWTKWKILNISDVICWINQLNLNATAMQL